MVERVEVDSTYTPHEYQLKTCATSTAASDERMYRRDEARPTAVASFVFQLPP